MEKFDRLLQKEMLTILIDAYPEQPDDIDYHSDLIDKADPKVLSANIYYLAEHRLIRIMESAATLDSGDSRWLFETATVTSKGIDFMLNDGGLSAILNVQTIKFHRDAVVVLEDLIAMSNMNDEQKEKAKSTLGELSTEALKTVVQAATSAGLSALLGK